MTSNSKYKALPVERGRSKKKGKFCFAHVLNQEPGIFILQIYIGYICRYIANPDLGIPNRSHAGYRNAGFPSTPLLAQDWLVWTFEMCRYEMCDCGCFPCGAQPFGDQVVANPILAHRCGWSGP